MEFLKWEEKKEVKFYRKEPDRYSREIHEFNKHIRREQLVNGNRRDGNLW